MILDTDKFLVSRNNTSYWITALDLKNGMSFYLTKVNNTQKNSKELNRK